MSRYDIVIVGGGIAGLECAENLRDSDLNILLVERNNNIGKKVCAGGITPIDLEYIPRSYLNFDFQKILIKYRNKQIIFPKKSGIISTVSRGVLLEDKAKKIKSASNIKVLSGIAASEIISDHSLELSSKEVVEFNYLVGADGANSIVRRYLRLPTRNQEMAFQYILPQKMKNFEICVDDRLWGSGYLWIFPHKDFTSVGCESDLRFISAKTLKGNLDLWLEQRKIDVSEARFESALINYDYRGYRFGNVFLVGDAAGLTSGLLGKGIYSAFLSGRQAAREILGEDDSRNLIEDWLGKKAKQEKYLLFLKNAFLRRIVFSFGTLLLNYQKFQKRVVKIIN